MKNGGRKLALGLCFGFFALVGIYMLIQGLAI